MTLSEEKAAARKVAYSRRKDAFARRTSHDTAGLEKALTPHAGKGLAGYMPMRTEINCIPAMATHFGAGGRVGVPVILGAGRPLKFREWTPTTSMIEGEFGALIPESGDWLVPEILVVPLLAFDRRGFRLGYGGGFYDRTLELLRAMGPIKAIGFAFAAQQIDRVPTEATDQPLDLIVTERGIVRPDL